MSIWNKILIFLIFFASLAFFFFAARTLKTHAVWKKCYHDHEQALNELQKKNHDLVEDEGVGIREIRRELEHLAATRTRVWNGCRPGPIGDLATVDKDGLSVTVESPTPHGIADKTVLYAFDENDVQAGGRYLGKFTVKGVTPQQVGLLPAYTMTDAELQRLKAAKGAWTLYENLPWDDNQLFSELDEATKKAMLPGTTVNEYLQDAYVPDPATGGKWKRPTRDYRVAFDMHYRQRAEMIKQIQAVAVDLATQKASNDAQTEHNQFLADEKNAAEKQLTRIQQERKEVVDHKTALEAELAKTRQAIDQLDKQNLAAAQWLGQTQKHLMERVEERARRIAQAEGEK